jgi:hypothetical protein
MGLLANYERWISVKCAKGLNAAARSGALGCPLCEF